MVTWIGLLSITVPVVRTHWMLDRNQGTKLIYHRTVTPTANGISNRCRDGLARLPRNASQTTDFYAVGSLNSERGCRLSCRGTGKEAALEQCTVHPSEIWSDPLG